eukprot:528848_1
MAIYNMVHVIFLILWLNVSSMTWTLSNVSISTLENTHDAFIGYYNKTMQILGGFSSRTDLLELHLDTGWNSLTTTPIYFKWEWSQSTIQIEEQLWMLPAHETYFNIFDLKQKNIVKNVSFPGVAYKNRCVTSYNQYIFIIGGVHGSRKEFHIYNRFTATWSMGRWLWYGRYLHSCNVVGDELYLIGGPSSNTVEYLDLNGCCNQTLYSSGIIAYFQTMNDRLSSVKQQHRSVVWKQFIFVIGGYDNIGGSFIDQVDIIDTISKTISYSPTNKLVYARCCVSAIVVENIIYVFGGWPLTADNMQYQYAVIPTSYINQTLSNNPSKSPTLTPSTLPSINPTLYPSGTPSKNPTHFPSLYPTLYPSKYPTLTPSTLPSINPSLYPTLYPSGTPSKNPTHFPSLYPTLYP